MSLRSIYLAYLSRPREERVLYRAIARYRCRRLLEIGIGSGERAVRLIQMAQSRRGSQPADYAGLDLFEARNGDDESGCSLKEAHRLLANHGAKIRLLPGDPYAVLARRANDLGKLDLIVVSESLGRGWFYVPRLLHENTQIFRDKQFPDGERCLIPLDHEQVDDLARRSSQTRAA